MIPGIRTLLLVIFVTVFRFEAGAQDYNTPDDGKPYIIRSIYFGGGSYYVDDDQKSELFLFLGSVILENYEIHIHSHTDNIGGVEYNQWLSKMRSEAVRDVLIDHLVPDNIIFIKDHGLRDPQFDNESWEGRRRNRRVDVVLWPKPS
ncbi:MAG: OmpA family protein [Saprospiraceae bacterium]|nr:OmpA family protein [Saprospiraceae bacterium]